MTISTEAGTVSQSRPRRPRFVEIALILSLALNCFIVGGVAMTAWHFRHPPMPPLDIDIEAISEAAALSPTETSDLLAFSRAARLNAAIMRSQNDPLLDSYLQELVRPNPRPDILADIQRKVRKNKDDMKEKISDDFVVWFQQLDVGKRQFIVSKIRDPRDPTIHGFRRILGMPIEERNPT